MNSNEIELRVEKLRTETGTDELPVKVVKIAEWLGYEAYYMESEDNEAGYVDHEEKSINVRKNDIASRQRFTIAHEIGHIVLHRDKLKHNRIIDVNINVYSDSDKTREIEANIFAAILLMPTVHFKEVWKIFKGDENRVAEYFAVSKLAVGIRANNLSLIGL